MKTFSTLLYCPLTTSSQTNIAVSGTEINLDTPNSSRLMATPANSPTTLPKLTMIRPIIMKKVIRNPNSSRIRSLRPLPVTAPIRADISCTTISASVVGMIVHSSRWPNCAPAAEYVQMPFGSLSTFAVIKPGPNTARNSRIRIRQRLHHLIAAVANWIWEHAHCRPRIYAASVSRQPLACYANNFFRHADCSPQKDTKGAKDLLSWRKNGQPDNWELATGHWQLLYSFARSRLITSSEVITPVSLPSSSTTGRVIRLYLSNSSATSFSLAPAWQEIRGSMLSGSKGSVGWASTSLGNVTAPTSRPSGSSR